MQRIGKLAQTRRQHPLVASPRHQSFDSLRGHVSYCLIHFYLVFATCRGQLGCLVLFASKGPSSVCPSAFDSSRKDVSGSLGPDHGLLHRDRLRAVADLQPRLRLPRGSTYLREWTSQLVLGVRKACLEGVSGEAHYSIQAFCMQFRSGAAQSIAELVAVATEDEEPPAVFGPSIPFTHITHTVFNAGVPKDSAREMQSSRHK